jgi:hypothetical protein
MVIERFGETVRTGGAGRTGIGIYKSWIYAELNGRIAQYALPAGSVVPRSAPETIVSGLPLGGAGSMYVMLQPPPTPANCRMTAFKTATAKQAIRGSV